MEWDVVDTKTPAKERTNIYRLMVQYFITVEHLSIDDAHTKVDAIYKFIREYG